MKFTTDIPTTPGFYAWRGNEHTEPEVFQLFIRNGLLKQRVAHTGQSSFLMPFGEWCRLVPAEEIKHAWHESRNFGPSGCSSNLNEWINSRAKRVMEGKE